MIKRFVFTFVCLSAFGLTALADVTLPRIINHNMVLQRGQPVPIWGWAAPGERIAVEFQGQKKSATTDQTGRWEVRLSSLKASSDPAQMVVTGGNRLVLTNILVGEVWLCSGQSNMEKPIGSQSGQKPVLNFEQELANADFPQIRLFKVEKAMAASPLKDVNSRGWFQCSSNAHETLKFSAAAYFMGRKIHLELGVPVGLIESSWGGTRIEPWTPPSGFESVKALHGKVELSTSGEKISNRTPTALYNAMIAPLVPFAFRGALWYQGESNMIDVPDGPIYADKMEALIRGWRKAWGMGNFSFYYVQLAPFTYFSDRDKPRSDSPERLAEMWETQETALRIPNTGMVVTTDLVDDVKDIHPRNKQDVGDRLARLALAKDYHQRNVVWSGPVFRKVKFDNGRALIAFDHTDGGLMCKDGKPLSWFTIAGADQKFVSANAVIDGDQVIVTSPEVTTPAAVRFAWHEKAMPNLFNGAGLPARPFRTDRYPIKPAAPADVSAKYFSNWPEGAAPAVVGKRVAENILARKFDFETNPRRKTLIYPEACAWYGALTMAALCADTNLQQRAVQRYQRFLNPEGSSHIPTNAHVDSRVIGIVPLELYIQTKDVGCLKQGRDLADAQWDNPTENGLTREARYWVDDIYMISCLQAQAFRATKDKKYLDRAASLIVAYLEKLQQTNGLFVHAADSPFYWGRGCGWYAAGMTEILSVLPTDHPQRERILAGYRKMMTGLLQYQSEDGLWRQLVDRPESWVETSGSAMFTFAMVSGVKNGWLEAEKYGSAARRAWLALVAKLDQNGNLKDVCVGTNKGFLEAGADLDRQLKFYLTRERKAGDLHGQSPMLWTASALLR
jgi:sialate O-acetylesterase